MPNTNKVKYLKSKQIVLKDKVVSGVVILEDEIIKAILPYDFKHQNIIDYKSNIIAPGLVDIHTHGYKGYSFSGVSSISDLVNLSQHYLSIGVTTLLASTSIKGIDNLVNVIDSKQVENIYGIHLEGPFINPLQYGASDPESNFLKPDLVLLKEIVKKSNNYLKMMTIASELEGNLENIEYLNNNDILVALGHSNALYKDVVKIADQVDVITHLANAMLPLSHRDMPLFGYGLNTNIMCELIGDMLHVEKEMLEIIFKVKSLDEIILISDSIALAGCKTGTYHLANYNLKINEKGLIVNDFNKISGSSFSLLKIVKTLKANFNFTLDQLFKMASYNPSKLLKINDQVGSIKENKLANLIVFNENFEIIDTYLKGKIVYNNQDRLVENKNLLKVLKDPEFLNFYSIKNKK